MEQSEDTSTLDASELARGGDADANRPSSSDGIGLAVVDPDTDSGSAIGDDGRTAADSGKRGRGRPRKSGGPSAKPRASTSQEKAVNVSGIESVLLAIHLGVSKLTGIAEFALDKEEANQLSVAAINVARHYDVGVLSPKVMAWLSLVGVMGAIYVPKMLMTKGRPKKEATQENEPQYFPLAANVVNMQMPPVFTSSVGNGK